MKKHLKIGIVLPNTPAYSETFFSSKINGLEREGYEVILFVGNKKRGVKSRFNVITSWPMASSNPILQITYMVFASFYLLLTGLKNTVKFIDLEIKDGEQLKNIIKKVYMNAHILPYNLKWLHFGFATMAVKRENVAKAIGAKMGVSFRGYDINVYPLKNDVVFKRLWEKVDKVHSISENLYIKAINLGLSPETPWEKITPAIDFNIFFPKPEQISKGLKILTVARLHWIKGLEYALEAMKILKKKGIQFEYAIIGEGPDYERLMFATHQLGIKDNVKFLKRRDKTEIAALMREYSLYLQPSLQEGFCNAVLEAQASGMLCLVSDADGLKENVLHNETGWVIKKRNAKEIANSIEFILNLSSINKETIRRHAVDRIVKDFNIEKQIKNFKMFYHI